MDLPNYFLADLQDTQALTPQLVTDACQALKQNRQKFLSPLRTETLIEIIARLAKDWLDPEFPFRKLALRHGPSVTGFSAATIETGLDKFFAQITRENLNALIVQDLGSLQRLDQFVSDETERRQNRSSIAIGPELMVHITGGVLPNSVLTNIILGLLVRSAQFIKCATGTTYLPRLFAHSLYAAQPKLASCLEIAEWKGGTTALEDPLFAETNLLTATGSDETLAGIRQRLPGHVRFLGYGHKLSFAYATRDALQKPEKVIASLADDVITWNQLGCLSPHAIFVESGGAIDAVQFAAQIANELHNREQTHPRGDLRAEAAAAIASRRMVYEARAASDPSTQIWQSESSTAWTVVHETSAEIGTSCLNRFIHVKPVDQFEDFLLNLEPLRGKISTVGLAAPVARLTELGARFAMLGVTRICRAGQMQNPPLTWRHDGRPTLGDLVTWTDIEL